jgi:neuronal guanine nucleotide exchange factor
MWNADAINVMMVISVVSDCPQVQCVFKYNAQEPDELTLEESDVINVFKKMGDGRWQENAREKVKERCHK